MESSDSDNDEFFDAHEELAFQRFNSFRKSFLTYRIPEKKGFNTQKTEYPFDDKFDDSIDGDYLNDETIELINIFNIYNVYNIYYNAEEYVSVKTEDNPCSSDSYPPIAPPRTKRGGSRRVTKLKEITCEENEDEVQGAGSQCSGPVVRRPGVRSGSQCAGPVVRRPGVRSGSQCAGPVVRRPGVRSGSQCTGAVVRDQHKLLPAPDHASIKNQCIKILDGINLSIDDNEIIPSCVTNTDRYFPHVSDDAGSSLVLYNNYNNNLSDSACSERWPLELVNIDEPSRVTDNEQLERPIRTINRRRSASAVSKDVITSLPQLVISDEGAENVACNRKRSLDVMCKNNESSDAVTINEPATVETPNKELLPVVIYDDEQVLGATSIDTYSSDDGRRRSQKRVSRVTIHKSPNKEHSSSFEYDDEQMRGAFSISGYSSDNDCHQKRMSPITIDNSPPVKSPRKKHSSSVVHDDEQMPGIVNINGNSPDESYHKEHTSSVNSNEKQWLNLTIINDCPVEASKADDISDASNTDDYMTASPSSIFNDCNQQSDDVFIDECDVYSSKGDGESSENDDVSSGKGEYSSDARRIRRRPDIGSNWRPRRLFRNDKQSSDDNNTKVDLSYLYNKYVLNNADMNEQREGTENRRTFQNFDENEENVTMHNGVSDDIQDESSSYSNDVNSVEGRELLSDKLCNLSRALPLDPVNDGELLSEKLANLSLQLPIIKTPPKSRRYSAEESPVIRSPPHRLSRSLSRNPSLRSQSTNYHSPLPPSTFEETEKASNLVHLYSTTNGRLRYERTVDLDLVEKITNDRLNRDTTDIQQNGPPLNSLTVQDLTDEEILNQVITSDDMLNEEEILEQVFIKDLDTGEMIPLSVAEEKLSHPDNALRLHIMRINIDGSGKQSTSHASDFPTATTVLQDKRKQLKRFIEKTRRKIKAVAAKYNVDHRKIDRGSSLFLNEHDCDSVNPNKMNNLNLLYDKDDTYDSGYHFKSGGYNRFKDQTDANGGNQPKKDHTMLDHIKLLKDLCGGHIGAIWTMNFVLYGKLLANAGKENIVRVWVMKDAALNFAEMRKQYTYHPLTRQRLEDAPFKSFSNETNIEFNPSSNELLI